MQKRTVRFAFDKRSEVTPDEVWSILVGYEYGPALRVALQMIAMIPIEDLVKAINEINRAETSGPMFDPSAWVSGARFSNARGYKEVLAALVTLRRLLPDIKIAS